MALRMPWWSLQQGYSGTSELAQIPGSPREVFMALNGTDSSSLLICWICHMLDVLICWMCHMLDTLVI